MISDIERPDKERGKRDGGKIEGQGTHVGRIGRNSGYWRVR